MRLPFRVYADIECMLVKTEDVNGDKIKKVASHVPSSSAFVIVDDTGRIDFHYQVTDHESCISKMINDLNKIHIDCLDRIINHKKYAPDYRELLRRKLNKELSDEELKEFNKSHMIHREKQICDI